MSSLTASVPGRVDCGVACSRTSCAVQTALKLQPNFADACNNLASIFSQLGDVPRAVEYYHAALRINPRIVDVHQNLGDLWLSQVPLCRMHAPHACSATVPLRHLSRCICVHQCAARAPGA